MAFYWKILIAVVLVALLLGVVIAILVEWKSAKKAGGFKAWVTDVPTVNYRTVRATYLSEVVVAYLTVAIISHSVWPGTFGDLQIEAIYAVFFFLGTLQGLNVAAFIGKRATANPEMVAATSAANEPGVLPAVDTTKSSDAKAETKTESTTVVPVPMPLADHPIPDGPLKAALDAASRATPPVGSASPAIADD